MQQRAGVSCPALCFGPFLVPLTVLLSPGLGIPLAEEVLALNIPQSSPMSSSCLTDSTTIFPLNELTSHFFFFLENQHLFSRLHSMQKAWKKQKQTGQGGATWKPQQKMDFLQSNSLWEGGMGLWGRGTKGRRGLCSSPRCPAHPDSHKRCCSDWAAP